MPPDWFVTLAGIAAILASCCLTVWLLNQR
jgi:hypothetical protein